MSEHQAKRPELKKSLLGTYFLEAYCKWCGDVTTNTGTNMCDRCWELDHRIAADRHLTERILHHYHGEAIALDELEHENYLSTLED